MLDPLPHSVPHGIMKPCFRGVISCRGSPSAGPGCCWQQEPGQALELPLGTASWELGQCCSALL